MAVSQYLNNSSLSNLFGGFGINNNSQGYYDAQQMQNQQVQLTTTHYPGQIFQGFVPQALEYPKLGAPNFKPAKSTALEWLDSRIMKGYLN